MEEKAVLAAVAAGEAGDSLALCKARGWDHAKFYPLLSSLASSECVTYEKETRNFYSLTADGLQVVEKGAPEILYFGAIAAAGGEASLADVKVSLAVFNVALWNVSSSGVVPGRIHWLSLIERPKERDGGESCRVGKMTPSYFFKNRASRRKEVLLASNHASHPAYTTCIVRIRRFPCFCLDAQSHTIAHRLLPACRTRCSRRRRVRA